MRKGWVRKWDPSHLRSLFVNRLDLLRSRVSTTSVSLVHDPSHDAKSHDHPQEPYFCNVKVKPKSSILFMNTLMLPPFKTHNPQTSFNFSAIFTWMRTKDLRAGFHSEPQRTCNITRVPECESWKVGINEHKINNGVLCLLLPAKFMWTLYSLFSKSRSFVHKLTLRITVVNKIHSCYVMVFGAHHPFIAFNQISV